MLTTFWQEMSKVTKFTLLSEASEDAELTCSLYWLSQFDRWVLQISCKISTETHFSFDKAAIESFKNVAEQQCNEPMEKTVTILLPQKIEIYQHL